LQQSWQATADGHVDNTIVDLDVGCDTAAVRNDGTSVTSIAIRAQALTGVGVEDARTTVSTGLARLA